MPVKYKFRWTNTLLCIFLSFWYSNQILDNYSECPFQKHAPIERKSVLVTAWSKSKCVVVSLAVRRRTKGCYNVTMPLRYKLRREITYDFSVGNIVKTNTNVFCARCFSFVFFFVYFCSILLWCLHISPYTKEAIPHFINSARDLMFLHCTTDSLRNVFGVNE